MRSDVVGRRHDLVPDSIEIQDVAFDFEVWTDLPCMKQKNGIANYAAFVSR